MSARTSTSELGGEIDAAYRAALDSLVREDAVGRLFRRDATLWKKDPEHQKIILNRLGWLDSPRWLRDHIQELTAFAAEIRTEGFTRVLLLGMGGSSLAPEVLALVMRGAPGAPTLEVLDSTGKVLANLPTSKRRGLSRVAWSMRLPPFTMFPFWSVKAPTPMLIEPDWSIT